MSINKFFEKENIQMLWEVLIDEPLIKQLCNSEIKQNELIRIFESNIGEFFVKEKNTCNNLIEMNKKYILLIINFVMKLNNSSSANNVQDSSMANQYKKIKIHPEEPVKQLITFEDIQNDRVSLFEKELNKKQEEFTNAMSIPTPPVPNFSDTLDQPLSEIELEIKRIQEQRNYDIEMINNTNKNNNNSIDENWLKPLETSIKNEKLMKINSIINSGNNTKHISWEDEQQQYQQYQKEETNIFNKLKKITNNDMDFESNNNHQLQIDEIKKEMFALNQKMDLILQKLDT